MRWARRAGDAPLAARRAAGAAAAAGVLLGTVSSYEYAKWRRIRRNIDKGNQILLDALRAGRSRP